jgi:hypothetical protein
MQPRFANAASKMMFDLCAGDPDSIAGLAGTGRQRI